MVAADSGFTTIDDMTDTTICVLSGTTTELNLTARMADIPTPLTFDENPQIQAAFIEGQCDGWTSDKSQLAGVRSAWPEDQGGPEALVILEETFSKEPLGPPCSTATRNGPRWWTGSSGHHAGGGVRIDSTNVDTFADTEDTNIRTSSVSRLRRRRDGAVRPGSRSPCRLCRRWWVRWAIMPRSTTATWVRNRPWLERLLNSLWTDGGLHYPPPYR